MDILEIINETVLVIHETEHRHNIKFVKDGFEYVVTGKDIEMMKRGIISAFLNK